MPPPEKLKIRNTLEDDLKKKMKRLARKLREKAHPKTIRELVNDCGTAYDDLETAHYAWVDYLHADQPDPGQAKQYLTTVAAWVDAIDTQYDKIIADAREMLPQTETSSEDASFNDSLSAGPPSQPLAPSGSFTLDLSEAMAEKLLPPSLDCMVFGDNPREWKLFESEFEVNVKCHFKCEKKLVSYLLKFTCNKAKAAVKPHVTSGSKTPFTDAWKDLKELFGTPAILARHILNDLKDGPSVVTADELLEFARDIKQAVDILAHTPHESDIKGHAIIDDLLVRLSNSVHVRWTKIALKHKVANEQYPDINDFLKFIKLLAAESNDEYYGIDASKRRATKSSMRYKDKKGGKRSDNSSSSFSQEIQNAAVVASSQTRTDGRKALPTSCLYCKGERHDLKSCQAFLGLEQSKRWDDNLNKSKICWKCLSVSCTLHAKCKVNNPCSCAMPFHFLLHCPPCSAQAPHSSHKGTNDNSCVQTKSGYTILPVLEVVCGKILTYALQDSASTASYITEDLVEKLNLSTSPSENFTRTINGVVDTNHRIVESIKVRGKGQCTYQTIKNVFVVSQVPASTRMVALDPETHPYLEGLNLGAQRNERVCLLVGSDSGLNRPLECREHPTHPENNPYAIRYPLGWAIAGSLHNVSPLNHATNDCAFIESHVQFAPSKHKDMGKKVSEKTTIITDEDTDGYNCKYTVCSHTPDGTGKYVRQAPQTTSMVSCTENVSTRLLGRGHVRAPVSLCSDVITPDELPYDESKYNSSMLHHQSPDLHVRNDSHSSKKASVSSSRRRHIVLSRCCRHGITPSSSCVQYSRRMSRRRHLTMPDSRSGEKAHTVGPISRSDAVAASSTHCVITSPPRHHVAITCASLDVAPPSTGGASALDEVNTSPPCHVTSNTANTAVKNSTLPNLTTITLGEHPQLDPKLPEFSLTNEIDHDHDTRSSTMCVLISMWFILLCLFSSLIHESIIFLCKAFWMLNFYIKSRIFKMADPLPDHVTPGNTLIRIQYICSIVTLIIFCASSINPTPVTSLQNHAPPGLLEHIQERNLTFPLLSDSNISTHERDPACAPSAGNINYTQERNLRHARFTAKMNNAGATTEGMAFIRIQQLVAQNILTFMLYFAAAHHFINFTTIYTGKVYKTILAVLKTILIWNRIPLTSLDVCNLLINLNFEQPYSSDVNTKPAVLNGLMKMKTLEHTRLRRPVTNWSS